MDDDRSSFIMHHRTRTQKQKMVHSEDGALIILAADCGVLEHKARSPARLNHLYKLNQLHSVSNITWINIGPFLNRNSEASIMSAFEDSKLLEASMRRSEALFEDYNPYIAEKIGFRYVSAISLISLHPAYSLTLT